MNNKTKTHEIIVRILAFPFIICIHQIFLQVHFVRRMFHFLLYGGENIVYNSKDQRANIGKIYDLIEEEFKKDFKTEE